MDIMKPPQNFFTGKIIRLLPFEKEDIPLSLRWNNDEAINTFNGSRIPNSLLEQNDWYEKTQHDKSKRKLVIANHEGEKVGMITLFNIDTKNQNCEIGIYISPEHQKKGYAREALNLLVSFCFYEMNMHKVYAKILSFNKPSVLLFESVGFKFEYAMKECFFTNGDFIDIAVYSIYRSGKYNKNILS